MSTLSGTNRLLPALGAAALLSILPTSSHALFGGGSGTQEPLGAVLAEVKGQVEFQAAGQAWVPATVQKPVATGDQLKTGADGTALIVLLDGTKLRVGSNAAFVMETQKAKRVDVRVNVGVLEAWVKKVQGRKFRVRTPTAVAAIRGTEFRVEVDRSGETTWDLFGGGLNVGDNFGNNVPIDAGQRLVAEPEKGVAEAKPQPIPPEVKMAPEPAALPPVPQGTKAPAPPVVPPPGTKPAAPPPQQATAPAPPPPPPQEIPADAGLLPPPGQTNQNLPPPPNPAQEQQVTNPMCQPTVSPSAPCP